MAMKVDVISRVTLVPSSPTPPHLKTFKLSFFDQLSPPLFVPIILFYPSQCDHQTVHELKKSAQLKKSLSETLTYFFPLAGRLKDGDLCVDCNDEGIHYFEARVGGQLSDVVEQPEVELLNQFLPFEPVGGKPYWDRQVLLAVQFNTFECGGTAIGVCFSHKLVDLSTFLALLNSWAATSRGAPCEAPRPCFDAATLFPPVNIPVTSDPLLSAAEEKIVTKRFVFDASAIASLRERAIMSNNSQMKLPTRVEALTAFITSHVAAATRQKTGEATKVCAAAHAVNLRGRMFPPLPENSFGNIWRLAVSQPSAVNDYGFLVQQQKDAIKKADGDFVKDLQSDSEGYFNSIKQVAEVASNGDVEFCLFSSWCRFPVYEVDFGWGKPIWACTATWPVKNGNILTSTRCGDGIEAWVHMLEEDMATLERDQEFISFTSSPRSVQEQWSS